MARTKATAQKMTGGKGPGNILLQRLQEGPLYPVCGKRIGTVPGRGIKGDPEVSKVYGLLIVLVFVEYPYRM